MELSLKEKQEIFWALLEKYPSFERGRKQAETLFNDKERLKEAINQINKHEKEYYALIKKFADETKTNLPEYKEPE